MARKYELKRRAERQEETRRRIVEATVELHETIGGVDTTIGAIAERAGVERATVYRHFPDERSLFTACTSHYLERNPPPDPEQWRSIEDWETRLGVALAEIYSYHRRTEKMNALAAIDLPKLPVLQEVLVPYFEYWRRVRDVLADGWGVGGEQRSLLTAAIGHAISFQTWQSLVREQGLDDAQAVKLMVAMVGCGSRGAGSTSRHRLDAVGPIR